MDSFSAHGSLLPDEQPHTPSASKRNSRRVFLITAGAGVLAVGLAGKLGWDFLRKNAVAFAESVTPPANVPDEPFTWFEIHADNRFVFYSPKIEMGQGIHSTLAQIAADELEADWSRASVVQADTARGFSPDAQFTGGSFSVSTLYLPIREAAAVARETLKSEAAARFGCLPSDISARNGVLTNTKNPEESITFGEIIAQKKGAWRLVHNASLKDASEFRLIGKEIPRLDFLDKVTGRAVYGLDARMPNMLFGAVVRPPRYGARLLSANAEKAAALEGVVKVVIEPQQNFAGVVATRRSIARAAAALVECDWEGGMTESQPDIDRLLSVEAFRESAGNDVEIQESGKAVKERSVADIVAEYKTATAAHAHLEPQAALADVRSDGVTIICSTQMPDIVRRIVAEALNIDKETILVKPVFAGGGFGRKGAHDVGVEAALLSRAVARPVHLGWTREEDMQYGYYRPPTYHRLRGSIDGNGRVRLFEHEIASGDVILGFVAVSGGKWAGRLADAFGIDPGAMTGALFEYDIEHSRVVSRRVKLPFLTASWRGLGLLPNTFARESFMDELACAAGADPIEFRLRHLPDTPLGVRYKNALKRVREISNWGAPPDKDRPTAKGAAFCLHSGTVAAQVAEVAVEDGALKVLRVWAAVDPGFAVNPDGARAQIQGAIVMGLSSVFHEKITFHEGLAAERNFHQYRLLSIAETPDIHVELLTSSDTPSGMGEVGVGPIAAAVGNALFALTGKRIRELPFPSLLSA
jgi:isoquinoline 1-oxidoreductase beta subunit